MARRMTHCETVPEQELLNRIERFCEAQKMSPTAFGRAAMNDGSFIATLRAGREMRSAGKRRVVEFMENYKADAADDPEAAAA